jgi:3-methyladenine DNA glycosylase Mpg
LVSFRNHSVYARIKEFFSDFVVKEIEDVKDGLIWRKNHLLFGKGLRIYMAHHFTEKYSNNVTGMAYGGAAVLIVAIGIRGFSSTLKKKNVWTECSRKWKMPAEASSKLCVVSSMISIS